MECQEKQRLTEEYFDAFERQQWLTQRLESVKAQGDPQRISAANQQAEASAEQCYEAWRAMNEHDCTERCIYC